MPTVAIPAWTSLGVFPPIDASAPTSPARSPYPVSLKDVVMRFALTPERRSVLIGFLNYRAALHGLGLTEGFQWLDGSFFEDVETIERRAPRDIDVVSFYHTAADLTLTDSQALLFDQAATKAKYKVDAYIVELNQITPRELVFWSAYWYSMWSHRRNQVWKGFLRVELAPTDDAEALAWLQQTHTQGQA